VKGSIEQILRLAKRYYHCGATVHLTDEKIREFIADSNQMAAKGLRSMNMIFFCLRKINLIF
jgi:magnesium-transporting ATPase (P-type)